MPDRLTPTEPELDLPDDDEGLGATERIDLQVQKAQEQLQQLKRQQDLIEKQKRELEDLNRRQEEFERGKTDLVDKLTRSLVVLEKQADDAQRRTEQLRATHESFSEHLHRLETINPNLWSQADLARELTRALSALDNANAEYRQCRARLLNDATPEEADAESTAALMDEYGEQEHDFGYWLKSGFAFTLPLLIVGLMLVIWLFFFFPSPK